MEGKLILVVEDNPDQADSILKALQKEGFTATGVPGVREAIFKLKNQKFSCVVLDLLLGQEDGSLLVDLIRNRKDIPNSTTPILVVSGGLSKETLKRLAGKIQGALVKPVDMDAFVAQVQKIAK